MMQVVQMGTKVWIHRDGKCVEVKVVGSEGENFLVSGQSESVSPNDMFKDERTAEHALHIL